MIGWVIEVGFEFSYFVFIVSLYGRDYFVVIVFLRAVCCKRIYIFRRSYFIENKLYFFLGWVFYLCVFFYWFFFLSFSLRELIFYYLLLSCLYCNLVNIFLMVSVIECIIFKLYNLLIFIYLNCCKFSILVFKGVKWEIIYLIRGYF